MSFGVRGFSSCSSVIVIETERVDIGIKINGLIHKSELSYKNFRHPLDIVSVGDVIECVIIGIDEGRKRIGLSLKQVPKEE